MNELMIFIEGGQYITFLTKEKTIMNALYEFEGICKDNRLNIRKLEYTMLSLKDENNNLIDEMECV